MRHYMHLVWSFISSGVCVIKADAGGQFPIGSISTQLNLLRSLSIGIIGQEVNADWTAEYDITLFT